MAKLAEVREEIAALSKAQVDVYDEYPDYDFPDDVVSEVAQRNAKLIDLQGQFKTLQDREAMGAAVRQTHDDMTRPAHGLQFPGDRKGSREAFTQTEGRKTAGQYFADDPEWKAYYARMAPSGVINSQMKIDSPAVQMPGGAKTLITGVSDTSGGALIFPDVQSGLVQLPFRPLTMRDIITIGTTNSDAVEYVRVTGYTNAAAMVAEATATGGGSGAKPESALALLKVSETVKTVAHWVAATTRAIADAGQLRTLIDAFLRDGLEQVLEDEMIAGDGTGEHFTGIATQTTQSQAWDTNILTTTRKAKTLVRVVGRAKPNAYLMHPNDVQTIDLLQDNEARYFNGGPREVLQPRLWGLPIVECEACTEGVGYVGDFKTLVLWDREQASIQVSNSHSDFFIRNLIAILAEMRAAFGVLRPTAIVEMDLTA